MADAARDTPIDDGSVRPTPRRVHELGNRLVIAALLTSPLMYLVELVAPRWAIYVLRAAWVVLVAVAAIVVARERRAARRRPPRPAGRRPDRSS